MKKQFKPILFGILAATVALVASSFVWAKNEEIKQKQENPVFQVRNNVDTNSAPDADTLGDKQEIINKRDLMSATFANAEDARINQYTTSFSTVPIHYIDPDSGWYRKIDLNWQTDTDGSFKDEKNNYHSYTPKNSTDFDIAIFDNVFEDPKISTTQSNDGKYLTKTNRNHNSISYKPLDMKWINNNGEEEIISNLQSVNGQKQDNKIIYKDAFGSGNNIEIINLAYGLKKDIVLNDKIEPQILSNADYLDISFELSLFETDKIKIKDKNDNSKQKDANDLSNNESVYTSEKIIIKDKNADNKDDGLDLQSYIQPAKACDSNNDCIDIELKIEKKNGNLYLTKHIPKSFLDNAVYPVRTDTTTTYNSDLNGDGGVLNGNADYLTARSATSGSSVESGNTATCGQDQNGVTFWYYIYRFFAPFNTDSLPDDAIISGANFKFIVNNDNTPTDFNITIVLTTQANGNALVADDYDTQGTISGGLVSTAGIAVGAYTTIAMNATGYGWIQKAAYTKLGLRSSRDISAITPLSVNDENVIIRTANNVGSEPQLEVTYTLPSAFMKMGKYW